jgi:hypothetical protein
LGSATGYGKTDCTTGGQDLFVDLELKFRASDLIATLSPISNKACVVVKLTSQFKSEHGGGDIEGEDVIIKLK